MEFISCCIYVGRPYYSSSVLEFFVPRITIRSPLAVEANDHLFEVIRSIDNYLILRIFFIICMRRSAPIEDEEDEPTPEEEEDELREEPSKWRRN